MIEATDKPLMLTCLRCQHTWLRRTLTRDPKQCPNPKCHSPYWNSKRVRNYERKANPSSDRVSGYIVFHKSHAAHPESFDGGPWFYQPENWQDDVFSLGYSSRQDAIQAAANDTWLARMSAVRIGLG
jgi:hypothetical protein